jgi:hypothetical protein
VTLGRFLIIFAGLVIAAFGAVQLDLAGAPAKPPSFKEADANFVRPRPAPPPVGMTDFVRLPRFKVELMTIKAVDETGWDFGGFDEIFAVYDNQQHRIVTSEYLMDSGDVLQFPGPGVEYFPGRLRGDPGQSCIWPVDERGDGRYIPTWHCAEAGGAAPVIFAVSLWEADPQHALGGFCIGGGPTVLPSGAKVPCISYHMHLFSTRIYVFDEAELLEKLPAPFDYMVLDDGYVQHAPLWETDRGFEYHIQVRVIRVHDYIEARPREVERIR